MTANVSLWQNVQVAIAALGASQVVSGVTKASPGVATYVGTDPSDGDYLYFTAQGMTQIDGRVFRADNVNSGSDTLELESEATTLYDTFTAGTMQPLSFSTTLATATNVSASGGDFDFIDISTIHSPVKSQIPGAANPATYTFENLWDVSDAGLIALKAASLTKSIRAVRFSFSNGQKLLFAGYVGATLLPTGQGQDKVTTSVVITMFGTPTVLAT